MVLSLTQVQALFGAQASGASSAGNAAAAIPALKRATEAGAEVKGMAQERKDPVTLTTLAQFRRALDKADTIEKALSDPRILQVLMPALGLPDQANNPGMVRRALLSDPSDPKGLAAQLGSSWQAAARTLGAFDKGLDALRDPAMVQRLSDAFVKYQYRLGLNEQQPGLADALYFLESAKNAKDVFGVLGDGVIRRVVTGALGLPDSMAIQSVETQGRAVTSRLKLETLQDDRAVRKLAERYLIAAANKAAEAQAGQPNDPMTIITGLSIRA
jgi:hypothetical protein